MWWSQKKRKMVFMESVYANFTCLTRKAVKTYRFKYAHLFKNWRSYRWFKCHRLHYGVANFGSYELKLGLKCCFWFQLSFAASVPLVWNSLPEKVCCCDSLYIFWRQLKGYLFHSAFPPQYLTGMDWPFWILTAFDTWLWLKVKR